MIRRWFTLGDDQLEMTTHLGIGIVVSFQLTLQTPTGTRRVRFAINTKHGFRRRTSSVERELRQRIDTDTRALSDIHVSALALLDELARRGVIRRALNDTFIKLIGP